MQDQVTVRSPAAEDAENERTVLMAVLEIHPGLITEADLIREFADNPDEFGCRDGLHRAVSDLSRVQLLRRCGEFVLPTRAAVRLKELWGILG